MKARRRHDLKTNALARKLHELPGFSYQYWLKWALAFLLAILVGVLIKNRMAASREAADRSQESLATARETYNELRMLIQFPVGPEDFASMRNERVRQIKDALAEADRSTDPKVKAEALALRGDLYLLLGNLPEIPEATTRPSLGLEQSTKDLLAMAEECYRKMQENKQYVTAAPSAVISAYFGLGAIMENRGAMTGDSSFWDKASNYYVTVLNDTHYADAYREQARRRLALLPQIRENVLEGKPLAPTTNPTALFPFLSGGTVPATNSSTTRPLVTTKPVAPDSQQDRAMMATVTRDDFQPDDLADATPLEIEGEEADVEHYRFRVSKNIARRIDQFLVDRVPGGYLSRAAVQRLIEDDLVKVNGRTVKASYKLKAGDVIEMVAPPEPVSEIVPEAIPLDIVYEDEHFLAVNKQADLIVHPARGKWTGTLVNGLVFYGSKWSGVNGAWRPGILHRLDRNTTGIMLVAKSDEAHWRIARQFENRTIQKTYLAVIHGVPELLGDVIDLPIGKDRYVREKQAVRKIENGGKQAVTSYQVAEKFISPPAPLAGAVVKLSPKTGRTHQLRVHMSAIGHPIVGDTIYGGRIFERGDFRFQRQALHAYEITFVHPATLKTITIAAPLPPDISTLLEILRS